jgi:hypothetical protein
VTTKTEQNNGITMFNTSNEGTGGLGINAFSRVLNQKVKTRCFLWISNTVVSNHFHSVKMLLLSSARSRDFDGMHQS